MPLPRRERSRFQQALQRQVRQRQQADRRRATIFAATIYLGTLGLVFVLPVVAGAYLGRWLDSRQPGYSVRWTLSFIVIGVAAGAFNVYQLMRQK